MERFQKLQETSRNLFTKYNMDQYGVPFSFSNFWGIFCQILANSGENS